MNKAKWENTAFWLEMAALATMVVSTGLYAFTDDVPYSTFAWALYLALRAIYAAVRALGADD